MFAIPDLVVRFNSRIAIMCEIRRINDVYVEGAQMNQTLLISVE